MEVFNIKQMKGGWFIGNFEPNTIRTRDFEVAHHFLKKDKPTDNHIHKIAKELTYIISGKIEVIDKFNTIVELGPGDMILIEPYECLLWKIIEDSDTIVIKIPSAPGDKYKLYGVDI